MAFMNDAVKFLNTSMFAFPLAYCWDLFSKQRALTEEAWQNRFCTLIASDIDTATKDFTQTMRWLPLSIKIDEVGLATYSLHYHSLRNNIITQAAIVYNTTPDMLVLLEFPYETISNDDMQ